MPDEYGMDLAPNTASSIAVQLNEVTINSSFHPSVQPFILPFIHPTINPSINPFIYICNHLTHNNANCSVQTIYPLFILGENFAQNQHFGGFGGARVSGVLR
jgi:hypothetical protein